MWYVGGIKDDTFNGFGVDMRYDSCYTGNTELGVMHGKGKIVEFGRKEVLVTNAEGVNETREVKEPRSYYEGTFNQGLKHGFGRCVFADSRVYVSHWVDDDMHGWGELYFPNGEVFKGYYATNKKNGYGIHRYEANISTNKEPYIDETIKLMSRREEQECFHTTSVRYVEYLVLKSDSR